MFILKSEKKMILVNGSCISYKAVARLQVNSGKGVTFIVSDAIVINILKIQVKAKNLYMFLFR